MGKDISVRIQEGLSKNANNYNSCLYGLAQGHIGNSILEVGCSIGNITQYLLNGSRKSGKVIGIDVVRESIDIISKKFKDDRRFKAYLMDASSKSLLRLKKERIDTVVCMNVLEHIKDDRKALDNFHKILIPKGKMIVMVPAFQSLYGSVDKSDHHFRRYTKKELKEKVEAVGFKIDIIRYSNFPGIFGWYLNGRILRKRMVGGGLMGFYDKIVPMIFKIEGVISPLAGLSVFCVCEK